MVPLRSREKIGFLYSWPFQILIFSHILRGTFDISIRTLLLKKRRVELRSSLKGSSIILGKTPTRITEIAMWSKEIERSSSIQATPTSRINSSKK